MDDINDLDQQIRQVSAIIVQQNWKRYCTLRALRQVVQSKREPVVVYYSTINYKQKIKADTDKLFFFLNAKKINYFKFNLVDNQMAQQWVKDILNKHSMPFVKINDIFIGGYEEIELLHDVDQLQNIINKVYEKQCLLCESERLPGDDCANCGKPYMFFQGN